MNSLFRVFVGRASFPINFIHRSIFPGNLLSLSLSALKIIRGKRNLHFRQGVVSPLQSELHREKNRDALDWLGLRDI